MHRQERIRRVVFQPGHQNYKWDHQRHIRKSPVYKLLIRNGQLSALFADCYRQCLFDPKGTYGEPQVVGAVPSAYELFKIAYKKEPENLFLEWQKQRERDNFETWNFLRRCLVDEQDFQIIIGWVRLEIRKTPEDVDEGIDLED